MSGASNRAKGAEYERDIARQLSLVFGETIRRNIAQARGDQGHDILAGPLLVECKRRQKLRTLYQWHAQARAAQAKLGEGALHLLPVVVTREDKGSSLVVMAFDDFCILLRHAFPKDAEPDPNQIPLAELLS